MSSVTRVPQTRKMDGSELSADDARTTLRRYGRMTLVRDSFVRFRYGDGFSHSRAFALQLVLALVPLGIAFVGLTATVHADQFSAVVREVLLRITPGTSDEVVRQTLEKSAKASGSGDELALWIGLAVAFVALTTSMGQIERGANRIYGIQRDRPALRKYSRAVLMALSAGLLSLLGFFVVVPGGTVGDVLARTYDWSDTQHLAWEIGRYPVGVLLALGAVTLMMERSPRRRQPGFSWIAVGAGVSLSLWFVFTYGLSFYVQTSGSFGGTYGPLTGIMALLIWANLTSMALFLGLAFSAQLEAARAGILEPERGDPESGTHQDQPV